MRILFMGTPDFAKVALENVLEAGFDVVGVVTQPDKPVGRKQVLTESAVKILANTHELPVYQPARLRDGELAPILDELKPDLILVVAYGKILPKYILDYPKFGCINSHGSLLPKFRGAAPIQWSIINGEQITGITTMYMNEGLDTGDIIYSVETKIGENETYGELYERLSQLSGELILQTLTDIKTGIAPKTPQNENEMTLAPPLTKENSQLDFNKSAIEVKNLIHGTNPKPIAHTKLEGKGFKVYNAVMGEKTQNAVGTMQKCKEGISVACGDNNTVILTKVQLEGSKAMPASVFMNGRNIEGLILGK